MLPHPELLRTRRPIQMPWLWHVSESHPRNASEASVRNNSSTASFLVNSAKDKSKERVLKFTFFFLLLCSFLTTKSERSLTIDGVVTMETSMTSSISLSSDSSTLSSLSTGTLFVAYFLQILGGVRLRPLENNLNQYYHLNKFPMVVLHRIQVGHFNLSARDRCRAMQSVM